MNLNFAYPIATTGPVVLHTNSAVASVNLDSGTANAAPYQGGQPSRSALFVYVRRYFRPVYFRNVRENILSSM